MPEPEAGIALCLSGGGYRAMLFHVGSLWRLNQVGMLPQLSRISSVSGGSITAATLALHWRNLQFNPAGVAQGFDKVTTAIRRLAGTTIDVGAGIKGIFTPGKSIGDYIAARYDDLLFKGATLQDLPTEGTPGSALTDPTTGPRFVINATNLQSGALWRFSKKYMADYLVGIINKPRVKLATAVAASSAFPPFLSPVHLRVRHEDFEPGQEPLHKPPYTTNVTLSDGGVYDNFGLETIWKRYATILVSNGGGKMQPSPSVPFDWARQSKRVLDVIDNQVRSLRTREVIDAFENGTRKGAYWGIRTDISEYNTPCLPAPHAQTLQLADISTRLAKLDAATQERLINWGYAVTDAALRCHVNSTPPAGTFPYNRGI